MICGVGHRYGLDPGLVWLWRRPVATDLIRPLAWEPPYAMGAALEKTKRQKDKKKKQNTWTKNDVWLINVNVNIQKWNFGKTTFINGIV